MTKFPEKTIEVIHIAEPELTFGHNQNLDNPKDGLFLYGPNRKTKNKNITIGVVGTGKGIGYFKKWLANHIKGVKVPEPTKREKANRLHLSNFPGLEEAFGISVDMENLLTYSLDTNDVIRTTSIENLHEAVSKTSDLFLDPIENHIKEEEQSIDVWVLVIPERVFERCRPIAGANRKFTLEPGEFVKKQKIRSDLPLFAGLIDNSLEDIFDDVPDFHRQVKAKLLKLAQPCQLIRETTVAPSEFLNKIGKPLRGTQDPATISWNLATGLYYKSQASPPWKLANMRDGVCYIGLVFKLIPNHKEKHACCAAQMFLSEGDGIVFRGANGPWMTDDYEFHLSKTAAKKLIQTVIKTYKTKFGKYPKELFIHGKTKFNKQEWEAFSEAAPIETNLVAIRIQPTKGDVKLFRDGDYPCIRGTAMILGDRDAYLWTSGYVPRIDTYVGPETPNPIFVTILRSTGATPQISSVLSDVMSLTKINYNNANYNDSQPVTIRFADKVGDVLVMGSAKNVEKQPFKYYI